MWPTKQLANVYGSLFVVTALFNSVLDNSGHMALKVRVKHVDGTSLTLQSLEHRITHRKPCLSAKFFTKLPTLTYLTQFQVEFRK
jgi:hypothetical protein